MWNRDGEGWWPGRAQATFPSLCHRGLGLLNTRNGWISIDSHLVNPTIAGRNHQMGQRTAVSRKGTVNSGLCGFVVCFSFLILPLRQNLTYPSLAWDSLHSWRWHWSSQPLPLCSNSEITAINRAWFSYLLPLLPSSPPPSFFSS